MQEVKDTKRAHVKISYDGRVLKTFKGTQARERFENELKVLKYLESVQCPFVPRVLEADPTRLLLVTTNAGKIVESLSEKKQQHLFACLESYGVKHNDEAMRNVTYDHRAGQFNIIDFEYAEIINDPDHVAPKPFPDEA